jgi:alginate O-acetyltransferase complex protein AlgI
MLFNSLHFLLFLPVVIALYYLLPFRQRWILVFLSSCYFYMAFVPKYILILFVIIIIDYFSALLIEKSTGRRRKTYLVFSLVSNILLLCFFKYFNFLNENLDAIAGIVDVDFQPVNLDIILPIGLSFHTFQSMSYTIEVYRGRQAAEKHFGYFSNYVLFFPQMVAGPIERYEGLGNELRRDHQIDYANLSNGFRLVLFGLFIKMTIADNIAPFVNEIYANPSLHGSHEILAAIFLFSFQIYADFFGYSTIALGSARLLGIKIMNNFQTPYLSESITEFWSRWHISLSSWFRDYLYIPLGGNRVSVPRWCLNIMLVFMISGLWHGASWTFVLWGALHGIMILAERFSRPLLPAKEKRSLLLRAILVIKTFVVTSFIWIFFRAESFANARAVIEGLFSNRHAQDPVPNMAYPLLFACAMVLVDLFLNQSRFDLLLGRYKALPRWAIYTLLIFCLFVLSGTEKFAFIYFQF